MGTPAFAVPSLEALAESATVVGVVSQPDRPRGRGLAAHAAPVSAVALDRGLPLIRPRTARDGELRDALHGWRPDLLVVAAYGKILPRVLLEIPVLGAINVHASLLPRHRGAAPIAAAILSGDTETGVTIMAMSEEMDAGDVLLQRRERIRPDDTSETLGNRLAALGASALREALGLLRGPGLMRTSQDGSLVTYAPRLAKEHGRIDWTESAVMIERKVRAFTPWPSAVTTLRGRSVKVLAARVSSDAVAATPAPEGAESVPGTVTAVGDVLRVTTGAGMIDLVVLQLEGRKALPAGPFAAGARVAAGTRFGA